MRRKPSKTLVRVSAALIVAMLGALVATFGDIRDPQQRLEVMLPTYIGAAVVLLFGMLAVRASTRELRESSSARMGDARAAAVSRIVWFVGTTIIALWTLNTLGVGIEALLLGGALTGVVLGIAARQTLGNLFAGLMLMVVRPFSIGQETILKSSLGEYQGRVNHIGLLYISMTTSNGRVAIPNAVVLDSAIGPGARTEPADEEKKGTNATDQDPSGPS